MHVVRLARNVWNLRHKKVPLARMVQGGCDFLCARRVVTHFGKKLLIDGDILNFPSRLILYSGLYETIEARQVAKLLVKGDRVLEMGTGCGFVTMLMADAVGERNILSYEANGDILRLARKNFSNNHYRSIKAVNAILTADSKALKAGKAPFYQHPYFLAGSSYDVKNGKPRDVKVDDINKVIKSFRPSVLVMDIEGEEVRLIPGIKSFKGIRAIMLEVHPDVVRPEELKTMYRHLARHGFIKDSANSHFLVETFIR